MNKRELRAVMARHGDRNEDLARIIGITAPSFSDKINGKSDFRQKEIQAIVSRYHLNDAELARIFFTHEVPEVGTKTEYHGTEVTT